MAGYIAQCEGSELNFQYSFFLKVGGDNNCYNHLMGLLWGLDEINV